ncbi:MAG: hypothetical protein LC664_16080 [Flavobacteriales bacterium]|nr:hypothetical protein [Flavobacteriales bacterium]
MAFQLNKSELWWIIVIGAISTTMLTSFGVNSERLEPLESDLANKNDSMNVEFLNIENSHIQQAFLDVVREYESLHDFNIELEQKPVKKSTMQAQPVVTFKGFFTGIKTYRIKVGEFVRDSDSLRVEQVPCEVLKGWFAHELGHVVDYAPYSNFGMIGFGLKYISSNKFKRKAEHRADQIAIDHDFHNEILATKVFILENDLLEDAYKEKIMKFYMSIEDVELCIEEKTPIEPKL